MQNKGLVRTLAVCLALVCAFYLSFSLIVSHYDKKAKDYASIAYLDDSEKETKLFENQAALLKQPVCRNGKTEATVGMCQKIWEGWK